MYLKEQTKMICYLTKDTSMFLGLDYDTIWWLYRDYCSMLVDCGISSDENFVLEPNEAIKSDFIRWCNVSPIQNARNQNENDSTST